MKLSIKLDKTSLDPKVASRSSELHLLNLDKPYKANIKAETLNSIVSTPYITESNVYKFK